VQCKLHLVHSIQLLVRILIIVTDHEAQVFHSVDMHRASAWTPALRNNAKGSQPREIQWYPCRYATCLRHLLGNVGALRATRFTALAALNLGCEQFRSIQHLAMCQLIFHYHALKSPPRGAHDKILGSFSKADVKRRCQSRRKVPSMSLGVEQPQWPQGEFNPNQRYECTNLKSTAGYVRSKEDA
jgi:hypothetical protein